MAETGADFAHPTKRRRSSRLWIVASQAARYTISNGGLFDKKRIKPAKQAYTLTEILTVIGIIGVLAAILLPVFFSVQEKGRRTTCTSNLRQIGHAFSMYVTDNDGLFPGALSGSTSAASIHNIVGQRWMASLLPYTGKTLLVCPDRELPGALADTASPSHSPMEPGISGYAMNDRFSDKVPNGAANGSIHLVGQAETRLRFPSLTLLAFDARTGVTSMNYPDVYPWPDEPAWRNKWTKASRHWWIMTHFKRELVEQYGGAERHSGGANYVFADNHVKWLKPDALSPSPQCDGVRPGFGL